MASCMVVNYALANLAYYHMLFVVHVRFLKVLTQGTIFIQNFTLRNLGMAMTLIHMDSCCVVYRAIFKLYFYVMLSVFQTKF